MQPHELYKFQPGRGLIINGDIYSGKERMARLIASNHGSYREMQARDINKRDGVSAMTVLDCETVIVHGMPTAPWAISAIKAMLTSCRYTGQTDPFSHAKRRYKNLIFCAARGKMDLPGHEPRRFDVIDLDAERSP